MIFMAVAVAEVAISHAGSQMKPPRSLLILPGRDSRSLKDGEEGEDRVSGGGKDYNLR